MDWTGEDDEVGGGGERCCWILGCYQLQLSRRINYSPTPRHTAPIKKIFLHINAPAHHLLQHRRYIHTHIQAVPLALPCPTSTSSSSALIKFLPTSPPPLGDGRRGELVRCSSTFSCCTSQALVHLVKCQVVILHPLFTRS